MTEGGTLEGRVEAILYVSGEPVKAIDIARALKIDLSELNMALDRLRDDYDYNQRGFMLRRFGSMVQLATRPLYAEDVVHMLQPVQKQTLSQAVMETLAVVAYKQPVTKAEVELVRGVKCDYSIQSLVNKGLICECGRKEALGRPILYGTTDEFLSHFGLSCLSDLPPMPGSSTDEQTDSEELIP